MFYPLLLGANTTLRKIELCADIPEVNFPPCLVQHSKPKRIVLPKRSGRMLDSGRRRHLCKDNSRRQVSLHREHLKPSHTTPSNHSRHMTTFIPRGHSMRIVWMSSEMRDKESPVNLALEVRPRLATSKIFRL